MQNHLKRVFVSIDLPQNLKDYLKTRQNQKIHWLKWVKPQNLHLTLNFLGYLTGEEISETEKILEALASGQQAFVLKFAKLKTEREMLWLIPEKNEKLLLLQQALKEQLENTRLLKREKRLYTPHILLARSKTDRPINLKFDDFIPQEFSVDRINLYESQLTPGAATHILIKSFPLSNS